MQKFEDVVVQQLGELNYDAEADDTTAMHAKMCSAIEVAIEEVLPTEERKQGVRRKVSDETKQLFEERTKLRGRASKEQFKDIQEKIKQSSLNDFESWVDEWATVISKANGQGDTRKIYKAVRTLGGKPKKPYGLEAGIGSGSATRREERHSAARLARRPRLEGDVRGPEPAARPLAREVELL